MNRIHDTPIYFFWIHFNINIPSVSNLPRGLCLLCSHTRTLTAFIPSPPYKPHALPISQCKTSESITESIFFYISHAYFSGVGNTLRGKDIFVTSLRKFLFRDALCTQIHLRLLISERNIAPMSSMLLRYLNIYFFIFILCHLHNRIFTKAIQLNFI